MVMNMAKRKNPDADPGIPDSSDDRKGPFRVHFDDAYFKSFKRLEVDQAGASEPAKAALVKGCEYSQPRQDLALIRDCALCKIVCGEQGWRYHYEQCSLRNRALREKEAEKKGDEAQSL